MNEQHYLGRCLGWRKDAERWGRVAKDVFGDLRLGDVSIDALPDSLAVINWMQIEDQGQTSSCAGHAYSSCAELAYAHASGGQIVQLSRMFAYLCAQQEDGFSGDDGSSISGNCTAGRDLGTCREDVYPFTGHYPRGGYRDIPPAAFADAKSYRIQSFTDLPDYTAVLAWLAKGVGGVDIGIGWNGTCEEYDDRIERYHGGGGGHSLALLDWDKKLKDGQGRPYIRLFNSWSKQWGDRGTKLIAPAVIDFWCRNETVVGLSDMRDVMPRSIDWTQVRLFA